MLSWDPERRPSFSGGHAPGYVGRTLVAPVRSGERIIEPARYAANKDAYEVHSATRSGRRLAKLCLRGELWPADKVTAAFCGVDFPQVEFSTEGEWEIAKRKTRAKKAED